MARVAVLVAISIALIGCGGAQSTSAQVRSVVQRYYAALESGNAPAVCSLLTEGAREHLVRPLLLFPRLHKQSIDCTKLMTLYATALKSEATALQELKSTKIGGATVIGNRATVTVTVPHQGLRVAPLVKTAKGWRIDELILRVAAPRKLIIR